jgi:hypothetical protein
MSDQITAINTNVPMHFVVQFFSLPLQYSLNIYVLDLNFFVIFSRTR